MRSRESESTVRRLSHYARCLRAAISRGLDTVTSTSLAEPCGISAASVRKDLSSYGEFGKQGSGYNTAKLLEVIESILGITEPPPLVLIGAGRIGRLLLEEGIPGTSYRFHGAYDINPDLTGSTFGEVTVRHTDELFSRVRDLDRFIGVIAVEAGTAQAAADLLVSCGCRGLLSFNVEPLRLPEGVKIRYSDLPFEMDILAHFLKDNE